MDWEFTIFAGTMLGMLVPMVVLGIYAVGLLGC